jgi:hypothetical protein
MGGQGNFNMNQSPVNYYSGRSPDPYAYRANYQQTGSGATDRDAVVASWGTRPVVVGSWRGKRTDPATTTRVARRIRTLTAPTTNNHRPRSPTCNYRITVRRATRVVVDGRLVHVEVALTSHERVTALPQRDICNYRITVRRP